MNACQRYSEAIEAVVDRGRWTEYQKLHLGLEDYPLAIRLMFLLRKHG